MHRVWEGRAKRVAQREPSFPHSPFFTVPHFFSAATKDYGTHGLDCRTAKRTGARTEDRRAAGQRASPRMSNGTNGGVFRQTSDTGKIHKQARGVGNRQDDVLLLERRRVSARLHHPCAYFEVSRAHAKKKRVHTTCDGQIDEKKKNTAGPEQNKGARGYLCAAPPNSPSEARVSTKRQKGSAQCRRDHRANGTAVLKTGPLAAHARRRVYERPRLLYKVLFLSRSLCTKYCFSISRSIQRGPTGSG